MYVVIELDGGWSEGDPLYVDQVYGPFKSRDEAEKWIKTNRGRFSRLLSAHEIFPTS